MLRATCERAGLAQLVAHPTCNRKVTGSSPVAGPTKIYGFLRSMTEAIAKTKEMAQLAHKSQTCHDSGDLNVLRNKPIPVARELSRALLNKN